MSDFENNIFLGKGWAFPPKFDFATKSPSMVSAEQDVKESLIILLSTMKNERVMFPDYGCDLVKMIFEEIDNSLHYYIIDLIKNVILIHEPRVDVDYIDLKTEIESVLITIEYTIRDTNSRHNLVYPFYISQGTNIDIHDKIY